MKHLEEHLETSKVNFEEFSNIIGYKKSILERQRVSEVKPGSGSPICEKLHLQIVKQFQNNAAHSKTISLSRVYNVGKRCRESGEITGSKISPGCPGPLGPQVALN